MELIDRQRKMYAAPNAAYHDDRRRLCGKEPLNPPLKAEDPEWDIRASYGASQWNASHHCTVRGVTVHKTAIREGDLHVWCQFPDGRVMLVRESNIQARGTHAAQGVELVQRAA